MVQIVKRTIAFGDIVEWAHDAGLPVQINTTIGTHNYELFDDAARMVEKLGAVLWSVFFLVPTGRASNDMQIDEHTSEQIMLKMARLTMTSSFDVKATAGPAFRRVLIEQLSAAGSNDTVLSTISPALRVGALRSYQSVNDGKGTVFISHTGEIYPSGFLPLAAGNVRTSSIVDVYRDSVLFQSLRNPSLLKGKCGECRYKAVCGGSRARAYGVFGDYLEYDPLCLYRDTQAAVSGSSGLSAQSG